MSVQTETFNKHSSTMDTNKPTQRQTLKSEHWGERPQKTERGRRMGHTEDPGMKRLQTSPEII